MGRIKSYVYMSIGCFFMSVGIYFFKIPNGFATGGVTGIGTLLGVVTPISPATWIWMLNIFLLVAGFIFLGKKTGVKTVYCSMLYSAITYFFEYFIPLNSPLSNQPLLELIYAMVLTSVGSALIFNFGGSSGGTDILALILKKYTVMDIGRALLFTDFIIAASSFFIFDIKAGLFSLLGLFSKAFIVDMVIENFNTCKYFVVITSKRYEISDYIIKNAHHGATVHEVTGEYTGDGKYMIHTVCKRAEAIKLRSEIRKIDKKAFVIITTSSEIIGRGFRSV